MLPMPRSTPLEQPVGTLIKIQQQARPLDQIAGNARAVQLGLNERREFCGLAHRYFFVCLGLLSVFCPQQKLWGRVSILAI
jgi:hypothetical protein